MLNKNYSYIILFAKALVLALKYKIAELNYKLLFIKAKDWAYLTLKQKKTTKPFIQTKEISDFEIA